MKPLIGIPLLLLGQIVLLTQIALAGDDPDRSKLFGSWQAAEPSEPHRTWTLISHDNVVRISITEDGRKLTEFECSPSGRDCVEEDSGKPAKVSMWFNGPKLVVMEVRGSEVTERRFSASGDQLEIEIIPIVPAGKPETLRVRRTSAP